MMSNVISAYAGRSNILLTVLLLVVMGASTVISGCCRNNTNVCGSKLKVSCADSAVTTELVSRYLYRCQKGEDPVYFSSSPLGCLSGLETDRCITDPYGPDKKTVGEQLKQIAKWAQQLPLANMTDWSKLIRSPDPPMEYEATSLLLCIGRTCPLPTNLLSNIMADRKEFWPRGVRNIVVRQDCRALGVYVTRRIPDRQAIVILPQDNQHMVGNLTLKTPIMMIFSSGVDEVGGGSAFRSSTSMFRDETAANVTDERSRKELRSGEILTKGEALWSPSKTAKLVVHEDGQVFVFRQRDGVWRKEMIWFTTARQVVQKYGTIAVYRMIDGMLQQPEIRWMSYSGRVDRPVSYLQMRQNGDLSVFDTTGQRVLGLYTDLIGADLRVTDNGSLHLVKDGNLLGYLGHVFIKQRAGKSIRE